MTANVIDTHVHIWPRGLVHPMQRRDDPLAASVDDLRQTLTDNGVVAAVACPASIHPDNDDLLRVHAANPWVLPVIGIDISDADALDSVPSLAERGAVGVRIRAGSATAGQVDQIADLASEHDLALQWAAPMAAAGLIERAASRRADVAQVIEHLGLPTDPTDLTALPKLAALAAIPAASVKLSGLYAVSRQAYPYHDTWDWIAGAVEAFGPDRTMWACDWPLATESVSYREQLQLVGRLPFLDDAARDAIVQGTARRVWARDRIAPAAG